MENGNYKISVLYEFTGITASVGFKR